jgi:hypothetical protein
MATRKRTTSQKNEIEITQENTNTVEEQQEKPIMRKKQIDLDMLVPCRNVTDGRLVYKSRKTGLQTIWMSHGDMEYIDVGELLTMKASQPKFLNEPWLVIEDDDVVEYLGLKHLYQRLVDTEDLDSFFNKTHTEMAGILDRIPNGTKDAIAIRARKLVEEGTLYDNRKIRVLEEKLKIDLSLFEK